MAAEAFVNEKFRKTQELHEQSREAARALFLAVAKDFAKNKVDTRAIEKAINDVFSSPKISVAYRSSPAKDGFYA